MRDVALARTSSVVKGGEREARAADTHTTLYRHLIAATQWDTEGAGRVSGDSSLKALSAGEEAKSSAYPRALSIKALGSRGGARDGRFSLPPSS